MLGPRGARSPAARWPPCGQCLVARAARAPRAGSSSSARGGRTPREKKPSKVPPWLLSPPCSGCRLRARAARRSCSGSQRASGVPCLGGASGPRGGTRAAGGWATPLPVVFPGRGSWLPRSAVRGGRRAGAPPGQRKRPSLGASPAGRDPNPSGPLLRRLRRRPGWRSRAGAPGSRREQLPACRCGLEAAPSAGSRVEPQVLAGRRGCGSRGRLPAPLELAAPEAPGLSEPSVSCPPGRFPAREFEALWLGPPPELSERVRSSSARAAARAPCPSHPGTQGKHPCQEPEPDQDPQRSS